MNLCELLCVLQYFIIYIDEVKNTERLQETLLWVIAGKGVGE